MSHGSSFFEIAQPEASPRKLGEIKNIHMSAKNLLEVMDKQSCDNDQRKLIFAIK